MMRLGLLFICLAGLLLVACGTAQPAPTMAAVVQGQGRDTAVSPTTTTTLPAINTAVTTATTPPPTATPLPTNTPTISPSFSSAPTGSIFFLWSAAPPPDGPDPSVTTNLYAAVYDKSLNTWEIRPIVEDLYGWTYMDVAPNFSQIALFYSENEDNAFSDMRKIAVYNILEGSFNVITDNECCLYSLDWLPDSRGIIYPQAHDLFLSELENTRPVKLITGDIFIQSNTEVFNPAISPDGQMLAVTLSSGNLALYHLQSQQVTILADIRYPSLHRTSVWSPDSQWLAFTSDFNQGLFLFNVNTSTVMTLNDVGILCFPSWSSKEPLLAFTCGSKLFLWDANTELPLEVANEEILGSPSWSPDGVTVAASFSNGNTGIFLLSASDNYQYPLNSKVASVAPALSSPIIWSPDGKWILFLWEDSEQSRYCVVDISNEMFFPVMDVTGLSLPHNFIWATTRTSSP